MTTRVFPPAYVASPCSANGRTYASPIGTPVDVADADAYVLGANNWTVLAPSGPTSGRIAVRGAGSLYFDNTLASLIIFDGVTWRNPATGAAV
jgi:hypothetical protein